MTDTQPAPAEPSTPPSGIPPMGGAAGSGSLRDYFSNWMARVRAGDTGALPVIARASAEPTMMVMTMSSADQCPNMRGPLRRSSARP